MIRPLFKHLPEIASSVQSAPHLLLFLDFDGTLAPLRDHPGDASAPPETLQALRNLSRSEHCSVAMVSGRALPDLRERVRLDDLIYAGNHGLEITGPQMHFIEPSAAARIDALEEITCHLTVLLREIPGVEVENKVFTASVHYRRASDDDFARIRRTVEGAVNGTGDLFQITPGLKVLEIRPRVKWHKGTAVRWIKETSGRGNALSVYVGDDLTDEDAFAAMPNDITVSVGRPAAASSARFYMEGQDGVQEFLVWLSKIAGNGRANEHR